MKSPPKQNTMSTQNKKLKSLIEYFYHWEKETPNNPFLRQPSGDQWKVLTYAQAGQEARRMTAALKAKGLQQGDHVGIFSKNCYHWVLADLAIMMGGYVSVPYYASLPKAQLAEVIEKSDIKLLFVGKLDKWGDRAEAVPEDVPIIRFPHYKEAKKIEQGLEWNDLLKQHEPVNENHIPNLDDLWTILFTSGTTGSPKGVMHPHRNPALLMQSEKESNFLGLYGIANYKLFSFLPLNHVAERIGIETPCLHFGGVMSFVESLDTFAKNLQDTQPTLIFAVPRIWTKFYLGVLNKMPQKKLDRLLKIPIVSGMVKKKLRKALGLADIQVAVTGAAITPGFLKQWYSKLGIHLIEAYGMTEVCGSISNSPNPATPMDTVGEVCPKCEIKIHPETGEILMKSPWVMTGYYNDPEKTAEVLRDGWIYSGDRGTVDEQGYVRVIGRVKDAFKTSKGSYITPNPMEEVLSKSDFIEQVCVAGLGIPQPIALINLSEIGKAADKDTIEKSLEQAIQEVNAELAAYQKISTIVINKDAWSENNGLLTPTLKIRRGQIDDFYSNHYLNWHEHDSKVIWES